MSYISEIVATLALISTFASITPVKCNRSNGFGPQAAWWQFDKSAVLQLTCPVKVWSVFMGRVRAVQGLVKRFEGLSRSSTCNFRSTAEDQGATGIRRQKNGWNKITSVYPVCRQHILALFWSLTSDPLHGHCCPGYTANKNMKLLLFMREVVGVATVCPTLAATEEIYMPQHKA